MAKERTLILDPAQIEARLARMAREIYEQHYQEKEIILVGIAGNGHSMAIRLAALLSSLASYPVHLRLLELHKEKPLSQPVHYNGTPSELRNKTVIVIDDVLNSGKTLVYAIRYLLDHDPRKLSACVLVARSHRRFPVRADFVGLGLSTNVKEHVEVITEGKDEGVYLV